MNASCTYYLPVQPINYHPGGTAFRLESMDSIARCQLKQKRDNFGRKHDVLRWVASGGHPSTVAEPCTEKCPLRVPIDVGNLGRSWSAYCPICHTSNLVKQPGPIRCRDCGETFEAYADWEQSE